MISKVVKMIIKFFHKIFGSKGGKKQRSVNKAHLREDKACLFTKEQLQVINNGIALGYNMKDIAKTKYSAQQMQILLYAKILNVSSQTFNSYILSPEEMMYNFYCATVDKYLGKDYFRYILQNGKYSICDPLIKKVIDEQLYQVLGEQEVAATVLKRLEDTPMHNVYDTICQLCKDRGMTYKDIITENVAYMYTLYNKKCGQLISNLQVEPMPYAKLKKTVRLSETVSQIMKRETLMSQLRPVKVYSRLTGDLVDKYYIVRTNRKVYLYNPNCVTIILN